MKRLYPLLIFLALIVTNSCHKVQKVQKDVHNYFPKVKTLSAVKQKDGSVVVTGEVLSSGNSDIAVIGFCMDSTPNPDMTTHQVMVNTLIDNKFSDTIWNLQPFTRYYFRAWAGNGNGYDIGSDMMVDSISYDSTLVACKPHQYYMSLVSTVTNQSSALYSDVFTYALGNGYQFSAESKNNYHIDVNFGDRPLPGAYSVIDIDGVGARNVNVHVENTMAHAGSKVYVVFLDANTIDVTICDLVVTLPLGAFPYDFTMSARFIATLN